MREALLSNKIAQEAYNQMNFTLRFCKTKELYEEVSFDARGRLSVKTAPMPGLLCTKMLPPCPFAIALARGSPSPVPEVWQAVWLR